MEVASNLDLQGQGLQSLDDIFTEEDAQLFVNVTSLNLQFNNLTEIPGNLGQLLPSLQIINLNNNPLSDIQSVVDILAEIPTLKSLFMSLTLEDEVDYVLKKLPKLEYLNGLAIDREEIEGAGRELEREGNQSSSEEEVVASAHKGEGNKHFEEQKQQVDDENEYQSETSSSESNDDDDDRYNGHQNNQVED